MQCLLDLEKNLGLTSEMPSGEFQSYYKCLLKDTAVFPGLGDPFYKAVLSGKDPPEPLAIEEGEADAPVQDNSDDEIRVAGGVERPERKAKAKAKRRPVAPDEPLEEDFDWDLPDLIPDPVVEDLPPPVAPNVVDADAQDAVVVAAIQAVVPRGRRRREYQPAVGEGEIVLDRYQPANSPAYENWILRWEAHGQTWEKKRNVTALATRVHGAIEPIAYLHAIKTQVCNGDQTFLGNPRAKPTPDQVAQEVESHRDAFDSILSSFP